MLDLFFNPCISQIARESLTLLGLRPHFMSATPYHTGELVGGPLTINNRLKTVDKLFS